MHDLFTNVLSKRDLSRAGDLFSVSDSEIVNDLNEVLTKIEIIITNPDYLQNKNDQSVVEICITRITSCIRETKTAERHCTGLVILLESCLKHNLQPSSKNEDPPHAKICADIISSIFLNYNKKAVMEVALPVAVKFLQKGNKELARNLASYLSLAAIDYAYLLSPHVQPILDSVISSNYGLCRVLPQIYKVSPEPLTHHAPLLVGLLPKCDVQEKLALLNLFELIAKNKPTVLESAVPQLCEFLIDTTTISATMMVLLKLAEERPNPLLEHFNKIKLAAQNNPTTITLAAKILSAAGKVNKERAQFALDFVLEQLPNTDRTSQTILLNEATKLCSSYPILFTDKVLACVRKRNNMSQKQIVSSQTEVNKTSGGVTIVKLNSPLQTIQLSQQQQQQSQLQQQTSSLLTTSTTSGIQNSIPTTVITTSVGTISTIATPSTLITTPTTITPTVSSPIVSHHVTTTVINTANTIVQNIEKTISSASHNMPLVLSTTTTDEKKSYTRRAKLGDSRSTGRLHPGSNTHRSMTRLNIAGGSVGGLHKSMTRLSSSQQINQNGSNSNNINCNSNAHVNGPTTSQNYVTPVPPLSSNVIVTGHNKWGIPSTKITSGGVTVTTSPPRIRPHSQGPSTLLGSSGALGKGSSNGVHNQSTGSIGLQQNSVCVHHASPASPTFGTQQSVMTLPVNSLSSNNSNQVSISGPLTVTSRRNDNTSITILNSNNTATQRMSVFEPYPMRDTIQHFCEKHLDKIKTFMSGVSQQLPPAAKCTIEERRSKKLSKLHFACQARGPHCLYSKTFFTMRTRNPRTWIHLMFLDLQARAHNALSSRDPSVSSLRHCWDILKCENKSFITLVTSAFPMTKDQDALVNELRHSGFFDVFELGPVVSNSNGTSTEDLELQWACFLCNHPEKAMGFLHGNTQPVIEGQLKEKKGKWRLFRRWRTRYFTLSGAHLSCKGSSGGESIDINQIRSVKVSRGARNIPKAFEIFTGDQTLILKPKDGKNAEEWVQYLSIVVAHSQARDTPTTKTNSLPARNLGNSRNF